MAFGVSGSDRNRGSGDRDPPFIHAAFCAGHPSYCVAPPASTSGSGVRPGSLLRSFLRDGRSGSGRGKGNRCQNDHHGEKSHNSRRQEKHREEKLDHGQKEHHEGKFEHGRCQNDHREGKFEDGHCQNDRRERKRDHSPPSQAPLRERGSAQGGAVRALVAASWDVMVSAQGQDVMAPNERRITIKDPAGGDARAQPRGISFPRPISAMLFASTPTTLASNSPSPPSQPPVDPDYRQITTLGNYPVQITIPGFKSRPRTPSPMSPLFTRARWDTFKRKFRRRAKILWIEFNTLPAGDLGEKFDLLAREANRDKTKREKKKKKKTKGESMPRKTTAWGENKQ